MCFLLITRQGHLNLDLVDAAEAVSVEELDEVPNGARTGHFPQALYRSRVLQLGVGSVSCGFFGHSGAVQRATLQQNPRARVIVQRFTADTKQSVPESHCRSCKRGKYRTVDRKETTSQSSSRGTQELSSTQEHKHKRGSSPEWACRSKCQGSLKSLYYIHHYVTIHLLVY